MKFWQHRYWFEPAGERFVYRRTAFSRGYDVSAVEREQLITGLSRLELHLLVEGLLAIALIGSLFWTGLVTSETPIPWFLILSIIAVLLLMPVALWRQDRLIRRVLGNRTPDIPRLPVREAMTRPLTMVSKKFAIPVLRSIGVLMTLFVLATDGVMAWLLYLVRFGDLPQTLPGGMSREALVAASWESGMFWGAMAMFNGLLVLLIFVQTREVRRLAMLPDPPAAENENSD